jgi:hypothetical protein
LYVWNSDTGAWQNMGDIRGPQGIAGPTGPAGATGATGPAGPQGPPGTLNTVYGGLYGLYDASSPTVINLPANTPTAIPFTNTLPSNNVTYQSTLPYTSVVVGMTGDYLVNYSITGVPDWKPAETFGSLTINGSPVPQAAANGWYSASANGINYVNVSAIVTLPANATVGISITSTMATTLSLSPQGNTSLTLVKIS